MKEKKAENDFLTTNHGQKVNHTDDSLKIGPRGPIIMDDHHFREKMMHFDHERIPERVVHARGAGAYGYFEVYESMEAYTSASFLQDSSKTTKVFVRFSTVVGSRGSADTVRDVRGFATKFYTDEGNFDLVGNNMPVFFIQDAIKFPDLVHAIKPEPDREIPQASAAHDGFWDFISLMPESMHMIMWVLSDRALPRSFSMMEGFGVHTFRFVNSSGKSHFVKFHWKPVGDMSSLVWDEAQKIAGKDPDFNRRDLWEAIEMGNYPEFELGVQILPEEDEFKFGFDILDATKIWPEELIPVKIIGKMTLNENPSDFFAETEQIAFHPGHLVTGIDLSNDPLLQGRLFSYLDTQLTRLGGPNFQEIPINRPIVEVNNNQRDGFMRQKVAKNPVNYFPNTRGHGCPMMAGRENMGFIHYPQEVSGNKIRDRAEGFRDHYSQATLFWNSMSDIEKQHIIEAAWFELGKVEEISIKERLVIHFAHIDFHLAKSVAEGIGVQVPSEQDMEKIREELNTTNALWENKVKVNESPALSMEHNKKADSIKGRKVAVLAEEGADLETVQKIKEWLKTQAATGEVVAAKGGNLSGQGGSVKVDKTYITTASVLFDSIIVVNGEDSVLRQMENGKTIHFVNEAYKHGKPIAFIGDALDLLEQTSLKHLPFKGNDRPETQEAEGVVFGDKIEQDFWNLYFDALAQHRHWNRKMKDKIPA